MFLYKLLFFVNCNIIVDWDDKLDCCKFHQRLIFSQTSKKMLLSLYLEQ